MEITGFQISWNFIIFLLTITFHAGATVYILIQHGKDIKQLKIDVKDGRVDLSRRLYDNQSLPLYVPATRCAEVRASCEDARKKEYDHLADTIRQHGDKVDKIYKIIMLLVRKRRSTNGKMIQ